jgi:hypothetical protein
MHAKYKNAEIALIWKPTVCNHNNAFFNAVCKTFYLLLSECVGVVLCPSLHLKKEDL